MSIHPETQKVVDYPDTQGKKIALDHYNWNNLDKVEEVFVARKIIELAKKIDSGK